MQKTVRTKNDQSKEKLPAVLEGLKAAGAVRKLKTIERPDHMDRDDRNSENIKIIVFVHQTFVLIVFSIAV